MHTNPNICTMQFTCTVRQPVRVRKACERKCNETYAVLRSVLEDTRALSREGSNGHLVDGCRVKYNQGKQYKRERMRSETRPGGVKWARHEGEAELEMKISPRIGATYRQQSWG